MEVNSRNPNNQILSASAHGSGCLPFLRLRIWPTFAVGQAAAVESEALLDTGASAFLMDWDFFVRNFPSTPTEKTEKILRYASGPATTTVSRMARMSFQIEGGRQQLILDETFFLIPQLAFNVYLGEGFLRANGVICFSRGGIYTSPDGLVDQTRLDGFLHSFDDVKRSPIWFQQRPPQANSVTKASSETKKDSRERIKKPIEWGIAAGRKTLGFYPTAARATSSPHTGAPVLDPASKGDNQTKTERKDIEKPTESVELQAASLTPFTCDDSMMTKPTEITPHFALTKKDAFDKMVCPYNIDGEEKSRMWRQYQKDGRTQIPVTNFVEKVAETNFLSGEVQNYYENLNDLMEVLDLAHLPQGPLDRMKKFLEENMDVFSRSETDVGYYPKYEARVSLRRDIKDFSVKFNPFPAAIRPKVRSILRRYHDIGIISFAREDIKDPIISNLVVIKKANNQIRCAYDARPTNYFAAKGKCYHRSLSQTLRDIDLNSRFFSILDLSSAYFCIPLHPDSRRYFCFRDADNKLCHFNVVVQGFVESDQHLSRVLEQIFPLNLPPRRATCHLSRRLRLVLQRILG